MHAEARRLWAGDPLPATGTVVIPIRREPWIVAGWDNLTSDLVLHLGWRDLYADHPDRYPHVDLGDLDSRRATLALPPTRRATSPQATA